MRRSWIVGFVILLVALFAVGRSFLFAYLPVLMFGAGALAVLGALDAALQPDSRWVAADQNKVVWVGLQLGGLLAFGVPGFVAALAYFVLVRPKLKAGTPVL